MNNYIDRKVPVCLSGKKNFQMNVPATYFKYCLAYLVCLFIFIHITAQTSKPPLFKVVAFYTAKNDPAHISFVHEANKWFLNDDFLSQYQVLVFLDTRPEKTPQRNAFKKYMDNGGAFIGFHFAGFALNNSSYPQNWDWYHNTFIGAGQYKSNTWRPTPAILKVEDSTHPVTKNLPATFRSSPNEWYRWEKDIRLNPDIKILLSVDPSSFPLGTGPKQSEIWHSGYYPVVWTNTKYKMLYINMGHNDIDYENKTKKELSSQFGNDIQDKMIIDGLIWLGTKQQ
jgi:uncharacterized protein